MSSEMTMPTARNPLERRREAIEISGWGARFHLFQVHNACLWVYLFLVVAGAWKLIGLVTPTAGVFATANSVAAATAGAFCIVFLLFLHYFDRWERTPANLAIAAFLGGGLAAPWLMAMPGNAAMMSLWAKLFGQSFAEDWEAGLTAPFVEETAKGAMFLLMLGLAPIVIRTVYDGLIVGAYVGLGFQVFEDMLYGQNSASRAFGENQADSVLDTFVLRALTGIASHALYTALFSAGVIYLIGTAAQPRRVGRGIALLLSPMILHGIWDSLGAISTGSLPALFALMVAITVISLGMLFVAINWAAERERGYMRDILAPEVANSTITDAELEAVAGSRKRRRKDKRAAVKARSDNVSRRREKLIIKATRDLGDDLARSHGEDTDEVLHARQEIARLRTHTH